MRQGGRQPAAHGTGGETRCGGRSQYGLDSAECDISRENGFQSIFIGDSVILWNVFHFYSFRRYKRRDRGRSAKARKRKRAEGRAPLDPRAFSRACGYARSSSVSAWVVAKAAAPTAAAAATAAEAAFKAPSSPVGARGLGSLTSFAGGCGSGCSGSGFGMGSGSGSGSGSGPTCVAMRP